VKLAIVGANGRVGAELCFLFRKDGVNVVPIVRNKIGAVFLNYHGFDCRIAEIANEDDAKNALHDIDVVVVAAVTYDIGLTRRSRRINDALVRNSVKFCKEQGKIEYLSSIRAFSSEVDENTPRFHPAAYDVEKKHGEDILFRTCKSEGKIGYALRLGHVFGRNQPRSWNIVELLSDRAEVHLQVAPNKLSNSLHVPTLKEAIMICAQSDLKPGTYSVVNCPQWTWQDVFNYYKGTGEVVFHGDLEKRRKNITKKMSQALYSLVAVRKRHRDLWDLNPASDVERRFDLLRLYLPTGLEGYFRNKYLPSRFSSELKEFLETNAPLYFNEFGYRPIPGPFIPGLSRTEILLKDQDAQETVFDSVSPIPFPAPISADPQALPRA